MQQYTVPQFIDVEDKIIGPITVRQFLIMMVGGLFIFLEYKLSDMILFITLAIPTVIVFGVFAFVKINGMPFHYFLLNVVQTLKLPKIRVWNRESATTKAKAEIKISKTTTTLPVKKLITTSRLSDLTLILDTGGIYKGEDTEPMSYKDFEK